MPYVFKKYRDKCVEIYGIDPFYFCTSLRLAWIEALKITKIRIRVIS